MPLHQNELLVGKVLANWAPAQACITKWEVGEQMVTFVRRLFGVRAYDNRSYEINSCHIAKVLRSVNTSTRTGPLNQRATEHDRKHEAGAQQ